MAHASQISLILCEPVEKHSSASYHDSRVENMDFSGRGIEHCCEPAESHDKIDRPKSILNFSRLIHDDTKDRIVLHHVLVGMQERINCNETIKHLDPPNRQNPIISEIQEDSASAGMIFAMKCRRAASFIIVV